MVSWTHSRDCEPMTPPKGGGEEMWNLFKILKEILDLFKTAVGLLEQIQKLHKGLKSGKRPRNGRPPFHTKKKKK